MKFKYRARTKEGELQVGYVEAGNRDSAANILSSHELYVLSIESAEGWTLFGEIASYFGRVKRKDIVIFTRQLATILDARVPLNAALRTLHDQTRQPVLKEAIIQMAEDIDSGLSLSQAMERRGRIFPQFYAGMVRAAEVTGNLNEAVGYIADYAEKESILAGKAVSALIYPAFVVALFFVVSLIMVVFVFPQIGPVFQNAGVQLPIYTAVLLGVGQFVSSWWLVLLIVLLVLIFLALYYVRTPEGQALVDDGKIKLPIARNVYLPLTITRFSNALALLIRGGTPVAQSLEIVGQMVGNVLYKDVINEIVEDVRRGELLSQSIAKHPDFFPPLVAQMIGVGETTGRVEQTFNRLSVFYGRQVDEVIGNLVDLIQPALMVIIGVMVGLLFASILLPLYSLTSSIH
jgi:type IV pilus assembly protein PilC